MLSLQREDDRGDVLDLYEVWDTLDTFITRPGKYIVEALDPIMKFRVY